MSLASSQAMSSPNRSKSLLLQSNNLSSHHHSDHEKEEIEEDIDPALEELEKKGSSFYFTNRVVVTSEGELDPSQLVRTEGYLWKKGGAVNARGGFRNWKKRWFVLAPVDFLGGKAYELRYFDGPNGNLKGTVGLANVEIHCEKKAHKNQTQKQKFLKFEFQLLLQNGGVLELSCDTEEERDEWFESLGIVITFLKRKMTTSHVMTLDGYDPLCEDDEESYQLGEAIAQNCQAYGPGLFGVEAGKLGQFLIQLHDLSGQKVSKGGMPVTATITNDTSLYYLQVQDHEDGSYSVSYTLGRAGSYHLNVTLNEEHHIFGSPFAIEVLPSRTIPSMCYAEGEALRRISSKQVSTFTIVAVDNYGNRKQRGGDPFEIGMIGPAQLLLLKDNDDGTYTCTVEALATNSNTTNTSTIGSNGRGTNHNAMQFATIMIVISLYGKPIKGSPFKPMLSDSPPTTTSTSNNNSNNTETTPNHNNSNSNIQSLKKAMEAAKARDESNHKKSETNTTITATNNHTSNTKSPSLSASQPVSTRPTLNAGIPPTRSGSIHYASPQSQSQLHKTAPPTVALPSHQEDPALQSPLSRLERSRQRALLAKSLAESNPATAPVTSAFHPNSNNTNNTTSNDSVLSSHFGVPIHTLLEKKTSSDLTLSPPPNNSGGGAAGGKLSQLAQKKNIQTRTLNPTTTTTATNNNNNPMNTSTVPLPPPVSSPVNNNTNTNKPRNTYLTDLSNNFKLGLGRMDASMNAASTPGEIELWEATHRALMDDKIIEKLLTHVETLSQLFSLFADRVEGVSVVKLITTKGHGGLYRLLELYEIIPSFLSKTEAKVLYNRILLAQRALKLPASMAGGGSALEFSSFVRLLVMVSIFTLSKTELLANHYPSPEAKLEVLLYKWGVADPARLAMVRQVLSSQYTTDI